MPVLLSADTLPDNLSGIDQIREDRVVDRSEGAGAGTLLRDAAAARREGENPALCDEEDVAV